jgi:hypothetical protein
VANLRQHRNDWNPLAVNAGMQIKTRLMRELIPLFFPTECSPSCPKWTRGASPVVRDISVLSRPPVFEAWRSTASDASKSTCDGVHIINIARLLPLADRSGEWKQDAEFQWLGSRFCHVRQRLLAVEALAGQSLSKFISTLHWRLSRI